MDAGGSSWGANRAAAYLITPEARNLFGESDMFIGVVLVERRWILRRLIQHDQTCHFTLLPLCRAPLPVRVLLDDVSPSPHGPLLLRAKRAPQTLPTG